MKFNDDLTLTMHHFTRTGGFLTAKSPDGVNTMTISWGFIGFIWAKPHFMVFVRSQRHTLKILEHARDFTVSIPYGTLKKELNICGTKSGADFDKSAVVEFAPAKTTQSPVVNGCDVYYECEIDYRDTLDTTQIPEAVLAQFYEGDFHHAFYGRIVNCYKKDAD